MSPMHIFVWVAGSFFQVTNATCLGSWLAGYGPRTAEDWEKQLAPFPTLQFVAGIAVFYLGLAANYFHDEELREIRRRIRRREEARQAKLAREKGTPKGSIEKHYRSRRPGCLSMRCTPTISSSGSNGRVSGWRAAGAAYRRACLS